MYRSFNKPEKRSSQPKTYNAWLISEYQESQSTTDLPNGSTKSPAMHEQISMKSENRQLNSANESSTKVVLPLKT